MKIRLDTKESERPVVDVSPLPMKGKEDQFNLKDDNESSISEISATKVSRRESATSSVKKKSPVQPTKMDTRFDIYSNSQKKKSKKNESESESESDSDSDSESDSESGTTDSNSVSSGYNSVVISPKEIESQKQEYLLKLHDLENKGFRLTRSFTMKSELDVNGMRNRNGISQWTFRPF
jgi:hypothetical protein